LVNLFDLKAVKLPIDWNTKGLSASSEDERGSALTAVHNPNCNSGILIDQESGADAVLWCLDY
jgi:hypothetical protein